MKHKIILLITFVALLMLCSCADAVDAILQKERPLEGEFAGAKEALTTHDEEEAVSTAEDIMNDPVTDLSAIMKEADSFADVPIYGTYLEQTSAVVRQYFKNGALFATVAFSDGNMIQDFDIYNPLGNLCCLNVTNRCRLQYPDCPIIGYVYVTDGFSAIYPVVMNVSENNVQFYFNELTDFRMVDAFRTIDDGRRAFENYFAEQAKLLSEIPVFPWKEADDNGNYRYLHYLHKFLLDDIWDDTALIEKLPNTEFIFEYDFSLAIPLLDNEGKEGVYVGYLLYQKNKLIAECVLKVDNSVYAAEFIHAAAYNAQTKSFDAIEKSNYEKAMNVLGDEVDNLLSSLDGVIWTGEDYGVRQPKSCIQ